MLIRLSIIAVKSLISQRAGLDTDAAIVTFYASKSMPAAHADVTNSMDAKAARKITVLHVTASPCFGGVERQMLALGHELRGWCKSVFASFLEEGRCWDFITTAAEQGWESHALRHDTPRMFAALAELMALARRVEASILCCHGYKANLLGLLAARRLGIPIVSVSHGWTAESLRVRVFEALDRRVLRRVDKVVCVSRARQKKFARRECPMAGCWSFAMLSRGSL